jgi:hypothetical protein
MVKIRESDTGVGRDYSTSWDLDRLVMEVFMLVSLITGAKSELKGMSCCSILTLIML